MFDTDFEPVHVWVDDRGRVRKMSFVVRIATENDGQAFDMSMSYSMSLFDFGEPVDIEVPDESEIVESRAVDGDTEVEDIGGRQSLTVRRTSWTFTAEHLDTDGKTTRDPRSANGDSMSRRVHS